MLTENHLSDQEAIEAYFVKVITLIFAVIYGTFGVGLISLLGLTPKFVVNYAKKSFIILDPGVIFRVLANI